MQGPTHRPAVRRAPLGRRLERRAKRTLLPLAAALWPPRPAPPDADLAAVRRILLVRQDNRLGNLVLMIPFLQAVRASFPQARIGLLLSDHYAAVHAESPWVDEQICERKRWLIRHPHAYPRHLATLRHGAWDLAFELSNPDTHSFYNAFLTVISGAPRRIGFAHPRSRSALSTPIAPPHRETHYALAPLLLLSALGASPDVPPLRLPPRSPAAGNGPTPPTGDRLLIHPGGRGAKRWPEERFAELIRGLPPELAERLTLIGSPGEAPRLQALAAASPGGAEVHLLRNLPALIAALQNARLYLGCDAGPMHLAVALGVPTLALFRTSHPLRYAPLGEIHETLLLGEQSRGLAAAEFFPAPAEGKAAPPVLWNPAFGARLAAQRPRCITPPTSLDEAHEAAFVLERLGQRWKVTAAGDGRAGGGGAQAGSTS